MKQVFNDNPRRLATLAAGLLLSAGAMAQQITVKGHVKDSQGEPVIGATVRVAGAQGGVVTDYDGNFTIKANKGQKLNVSFVGYQQATVAAAPGVQVVLQDDNAVLDNVVVIGYGRAKKNDLTGSVTAIKPDDLSKGITNSASDMLVGKVAGVDVQTSGGTPGAGAQIRIRGGSSLNASNDPLIVVDGLAIDKNTATGMSNVMAMINPADVESFTVLKDASATAIYGSRASNGVIIITTKKGKAGGTKVSYNGDVTISTIQKKYDVLDATAYKGLVSGVMGEEKAAMLGDADTNWQDEIFRTSVSTNHNLSISGALSSKGGSGGKAAFNMPYRVSVGFNASDGIIKKSYMRRGNVGVNLSPSMLDDHLKFVITSKYTYEKNHFVDAGSVIGSALSIDPTRPIHTDDATSPYFGGYYQPYVDGADAMKANGWMYTNNKNATQNPVAYLNDVSCIANAQDVTANIEGDYKIHGLEDLHLHFNIGGQYTDSKQDDVTSNTSFNCNYYGWVGKTTYYKYSLTANAYAQYQHTFGAHDIDVMAGAEQSHFHRNGHSGYGQGTDPYSGEANNPTTFGEAAWATHNSLVSYFGRLNYTLLERYMLTATMRADGSSRFADGNRWGYFPSVALAWKINDEKFMKNLDWWNEFKLRLGWGQTGQQELDDEFGYMPLYVVSDSYAQYAFGDTYYSTQRPNGYNPDRKWETTTTYNAGLDLGFLNNRITASIDGYYRKTTDLLNTVTIPVGANFAQTQTRNIGSLENYGVEFAINAKPIVTKDFTWDVNYNVAWNHNEITELVDGDDTGYYIMNTTNQISRGNATRIQANTVGKPINSFFVYQQVYDESGKPLEGVYVDRNGDGQINESDRYFYKSPAPAVTMGFTTKLLYKSWDLSIALRASLGNYVYYDFLSDRASVSESGLYSNSAFRNTTPEAVALGFTGTGNSEYYLSDYFVRNASYLKCTNITLGYTFPHLFKLNGKNRCGGRVYATVQNPFIITKYDGIDPEVSSGIDSNPYPRPVSFQLGLNLNF